MDPAIESVQERARPVASGSRGARFADVRRALRARAEPIRWFALRWLTVTIGVFSVLAIVRGVPSSPGLGIAEAPVQVGLLGLAVLGGLVAIRVPGVGATLTTLAGFGVGIYASVEFPPVLAFLAALAFLVPGVLLWLVWQGQRGAVAVAALAMLMVGLLVAGYAASSKFYYTYFGASHPGSAAALERSVARWIWSGAVTPVSAVVVAKPADPSATVSLVVWVDPDGEERPVDDPDFVRRTLRSRWTYLLWSVVGAAVGGFAAWLAFEEYDDPLAYLAHNPWLIVAGVGAVAVFGMVAVLLTVPFLLYGRLPAALREWIASNRLLGRPAAPPPPPGGYVETVAGEMVSERRRIRSA
jgi:hypothetical protein